jgi:hypothetical protein
VLAIQIFFELGLGGIINQFVAHEMAHLSFKTATQIEGNPESLSRLTSLMHFSLKWYIVFASLLFITLQIVGYYFFTKFGGNNTTVQWQIPWIIIAFGSSLNLLISPWMAVLQGMSKVKEMARLALIQQLVIMTITWLSLILGAKLYVAGINSMTGFAILSILYSRTTYPRLLIKTYKLKIKERISYQHEIFPYQWKIAMSWISGYFIFQLFNPVIFAFIGAAAAGQMGMTLAVLNSIMALVISWTTTKIPLWSTFIANHDYVNFDLSFNRVIRDSTVVSITSIIIFIVFIAVIGQLQLPLAGRFLPLWLCLILSVTIPLNNIINSWATYLRCHKKEPFLVQAITIGLLCAFSTIVTAKYIGIAGVVVGYTAIVIFASVPLSYLIFINKRKMYHA